MSDRADLFRFLKRIRRRWVLWRALEAGGACAAIAAIGGIIVAGVLLWRGEASGAVTGAMLAAGAAGGLIFGLTHRPTLLQTATHADRELGLCDLLSTALMIGGGSGADRPFAAAVLADAEARCRGIPPSELIVRRLGGRAWGGVGIAVGLLIAMSLLSGEAATRAAEDARVVGIGRRAFDAAGDGDGPSRRGERRTDPQRRWEREGLPAEQTDRGEGAEPDSGDRPGDAGQPGASSDLRSARRMGDSEGTSAGRSDDPAAAALRRRTASAPAPSRSVPWSSPDWPAAREAAGVAIRTGRVPEEFRDLVRAYFDRAQP